MGACPKCGKEADPSARVCPACGVIMAKVRAMGIEPPARGARPTSPASPTRAYIPAEPSHVEPRSALLNVSLAAAGAIALLFVLSRLREEVPPPAAPAASAVREAAPKPSVTAEGTISQADIAFLNELSGRLQSNQGLLATPTEIQRVERIANENRTAAPVRALLIDLYLRGANQDLRAGLFPSVDLAIGRMKLIDDQRPEVYAFEALARARQDDWTGALTAAQRYDEVQGAANVTLSVTLAVALEKTGRRADALAVLGRPVFEACVSGAVEIDTGACRTAEQMRQLLSASVADPPPNPLARAEPRARAELVVDASKDQLRSERFDIRFDGENQTGVARDVRFVLDRAYVRLADIYYERPSRKIPVVLHSQQDYYSATGAPWWSGGVYSSHNGSIQIPIRGLPSTLPREMEDVLVHELSHAFVDEMSGGRAGRSLQEGLAQYMEGKRIEQEMGPAELKRLATSGQKNVMSFYMLSLVISQHLVQSRGQGKINDLLRAIKETGSEDAGYRKVFGQPAATIERDILETFWRRYS